ncbi:hypothetical protein [uncultured Sphaerochaeta sp.]|uniref:hypothetical protein n=1 Tax=uncultured Sphaerochaeta sp. TaxID=886478 RepID=UPI002A0A273E|nr:hypothetical protein [uncultured Sphaerochaeta sp.]
MTETNDSMFFAMKLLEFEDADDPLLAMIQWCTYQMIELEVGQKYNGERVHSSGTTCQYFVCG